MTEFAIITFEFCVLGFQMGVCAKIVSSNGQKRSRICLKKNIPSPQEHGEGTYEKVKLS